MDTIFNLENDKLIAVFMDGTYCEYPDKIFPGEFGYNFKKKVCNSNWWNVKNLEYQTSWSWLMPVVEKIIQIPDTHITALNWLIKIEGDISQLVNYQVTSMRYLKRKDATFIGAYYFVVIEFIKWHNQKAQLSEPKV